MRKIFTVVSLISTMLVSMLVPVTAGAAVVDQALTERLKGYTLLSVDEGGALYYVNPDTGIAKYLGTHEATWSVIKTEMIGITNADLARVETDTALRTRLMGRFLLAVEAKGEVHYLRPSDQKLHYLGTGASTFDKLKFLALGVNEENMMKLQTDRTSFVTPTPVPELPTTPSPVEEESFIDAQVALDFVEIFANGYDQFYADFNYYPEVKYFEDLFTWNQPIYLTENGFGLAPGATNYFVWEQVNDEFKDFYATLFAAEVLNQEYALLFMLPGMAVTDEGVILEQGFYYYTNTQGLLSEEEFVNQILDEITEILEEDQVLTADEEAERVIETVRLIQSGIREYWEDRNTWPLTGQDPIILGENGGNRLSWEGHFWGEEDDKSIYIDHIPSGQPSTHFVYLAPEWGQPYSLTFELHGNYDGFTPGKYEAIPFDKIRRIGDLD